MSTPMSFLDACEAICEELRERLTAQNIAVFPFPARRHDERGWVVGHTVQNVNGTPTTLINQLTQEFEPEEWAFLEPRILAFIDAIASRPHDVSALIRTSQGMPTYKAVICGLHLRFLHMPSGVLRLDVLLG